MHSMQDVASSSLPLVQYVDWKEDSNPNIYKDTILTRTYEHVTPPTQISKVLDGELIMFGNLRNFWDMMKEDIKR